MAGTLTSRALATPPRGMRIGELAGELGISADTIRFYEKAGWLPRPRRAAGNLYREYGPDEVEHARLLLDLRRIDVPLPVAARVATWCHSGHCDDTTRHLPDIIAERRRAVAERIERLAQLDAQLARLERHLRASRPGALPVLEGRGQPCCETAASVRAAASGCGCCSTTDEA